MAVENGHFELAKELLDAGANPNDQSVGWTPLHQLVFTRRPNPEAVVYAVREQRVDAGPGSENLGLSDAARGGVAIAGGAKVAAKLFGDPRGGADPEHGNSVAAAPALLARFFRARRSAARCSARRSQA